MSRDKQRRVFDKIKSFGTHIGGESFFVGDFSGKDNCMVEGSVTGNCRSDGSIVVAHGARWQGNIEAVNVLVAGEVNGNITAVNQVELLATGRVTGRLTCPNIAVAEGAVHAGEIRMSRDTSVTQFNERRSPDIE